MVKSSVFERRRGSPAPCRRSAARTGANNSSIPKTASLHSRQRRRLVRPFVASALRTVSMMIGALTPRGFPRTHSRPPRSPAMFTSSKNQDQVYPCAPTQLFLPLFSHQLSQYPRLESVVRKRAESAARRQHEVSPRHRCPLSGPPVA